MHFDELNQYWKRDTASEPTDAYVAEARRIATQPQNEVPVALLGLSYNILGFEAMKAGELYVSESHYQQCERLYDLPSSPPFPIHRATLYHRWALTKAWLASKSIGNSEAHYEAAFGKLALARDLCWGEPEHEGQNAYFYGLVYTFQDRFEKALDAFGAAAEKSKTFRDYATANWVATLARLPVQSERELNEQYELVEHLRSSKRAKRRPLVKKKRRQPRNKATKLDASYRWIQGLLATRLGNRATAIEKLSTAAETFAELKLPLMASSTRLDLAFALVSLSQRVPWRRTVEVLTEALPDEQDAPAREFARRLLALAEVKDKETFRKHYGAARAQI